MERHSSFLSAPVDFRFVADAELDVSNVVRARAVELDHELVGDPS